MNSIPGPAIYGKTIDTQTRCVHYGAEKDIVAIKFKCCGHYYPCSECHRETAGHIAEVWPENEWSEKAVLCGACGTEMTILEYFDSGNQCPSCEAFFNPGCSKHYHLYFDRQPE